MRPNRLNRGFSLLELVVATAVTFIVFMQP